MKRRLPSKEDHPIGCAVCGQKWRFDSDGPTGLGRITAVHAPGPCVPRVESFEPDYEVGGKVAKDKICAWRKCRKPFVTFSAARLTCSTKCGVERDCENDREYHRQRKQATA